MTRVIEAENEYSAKKAIELYFIKVDIISIIKYK